MTTGEAASELVKPATPAGEALSTSEPAGLAWSQKLLALGVIVALVYLFVRTRPNRHSASGKWDKGNV